MSFPFWLPSNKDKIDVNQTYHHEAKENLIDYVLFVPNLIDPSGEYTQPWVQIHNVVGELLGTTNFANQRMHFSKRYKGRLVFEISLNHESFYGKEWKGVVLNSSATNDLNTWWRRTFKLPGVLKIVGHESCCGIRFLHVELID